MTAKKKTVAVVSENHVYPLSADNFLPPRPDSGIAPDNGIQFTNHDRHIYAFEHIFDRVCREHQIEHRLTKIKHPWTNGQVERMNRTIKEIIRPMVPVLLRRRLRATPSTR